MSADVNEYELRLLINLSKTQVYTGIANLKKGGD
jgi:hypothetical protein